MLLAGVDACSGVISVQQTWSLNGVCRLGAQSSFPGEGFCDDFPAAWKAPSANTSAEFSRVVLSGCLGFAGPSQLIPTLTHSRAIHEWGCIPQDVARIRNLVHL